MQTNEPRPDAFEATIIPFMLVFFPLVLILGIVDHFFLSDYDLQLPTLALAAAAGALNVWLRRRRAERMAETAEGGSTFEFESWLSGPAGR
jgi:hypothetical protein